MASTCIIIPCYNEEKRLDLDTFRLFTEQHPDFDFCFVNDGSKDGTASKLERFVREHPARFQFCNLSINGGKAEAVRQGVLQAVQTGQYSYTGYLDADLATPLKELYTLQEVTSKRREVRFVMGVRLKRLGAEIHRNSFRHYAGRIFATLVSVLYHLPTYDSQCGAKLIECRLAQEIFSVPFKSNWLFDIELILRVRRIYPDYDHIIYEMPLNEWIEKGDSRIKFTHLLKMPAQFYAIYRAYRS